MNPQSDMETGIRFFYNPTNKGAYELRFCGIQIGAKATMGDNEYVQDRLLFYKDGNTYLVAA
jgi:hypothetical protein